MTPVRFITRGAMVTIHRDYISVSVTRFVRENACGEFDKIAPDYNNPKRFRATYAKGKFLSEISDIDSFIDEVISEFKDRARY